MEHFEKKNSLHGGRHFEINEKIEEAILYKTLKPIVALNLCLLIMVVGLFGMTIWAN